IRTMFNPGGSGDGGVWGLQIAPHTPHPRVIQTMASLDPLEILRMDTTCSICLDYLMDPVTIGCGHSFCRTCISRCWETRTQDFLCPVCRELCALNIMVPNRQLASVVEIAKQLHSPKRKLPDEPVCPQHYEVLHFFCKEDQEVMCLMCAVSHGDRAHSVEPLEDVMMEYKVWDYYPLAVTARTQFLLRVWERIQECCHRQRIICDFEELFSLLAEEKEAQLLRLKAEEAAILEKLKGSRALLSEQRLSLSKLIADMEEKSLQSGPEILKVISSFLIFCLCPGDMTLDPETAHPNLMLSENLKSVHFINISQVLQDTPRRFTLYPCVLGSAAYTSGRHYWEVDVGNKTQWALGVCYESVSRNAKVDTKPEAGYWRVRLWNGKYAATTTPFTPLHLRVKPKRVGVFLDYEAGKVSFYNVTDHSHIYTFSVAFAEPVCPLFYPGIRFGHVNAAPLVICQPLDWE
uniref:Uncharacterized protein n=1 Tax=Pelusios castaneus TaxID=367368 RepID=A0A8C8SQ00_9SAUR